MKTHDTDAASGRPASNTAKTAVEYLNPPGMHKNPAFSQGAIISAGARMLLIGGQNSVAPDGTVVGPGDIAAQVKQTLANVEKVLAAAGLTEEAVVRWTIFYVHGVNLQHMYAAYAQSAKPRKDAALVTAAAVSALANPGYLIEISAEAVLP